MPLSCPWRAGAVACLSLLLACVPPALATPQPRNNSLVGESPTSLAGLVKRVLDTSPELLAAQASANAARARLEGASRPLNNPELSAEVERTDVSAYAVGVSQTIDWHDKRESQAQIAQAELASAEAELELKRLDMAAGLVANVGRLAAVHETLSLAKRRVDMLSSVVELAEKRLAAGDISPPELELARLTQSEAALQYAGLRSDLIQQRSEFSALAGDDLDYQVKFPKRLPSNLSSPSDIASQAREHPQVRLAELAAQLARARMRATDRDRLTDPTVGVALGRDGGENRVSVSISIPLQLRNNFQGSVDAASAEALAAEQRVLREQRAQLARVTAARERFNLTARVWSQWAGATRTSLKDHVSALQDQWEAGEVNTADYLLQLRQSLDTEISGVELHASLWDAWSDWLHATGTLLQWLNETER